jgi:hypothetical protein
MAHKPALAHSTQAHIRGPEDSCTTSAPPWANTKSVVRGHRVLLCLSPPGTCACSASKRFLTHGQTKQFEPFTHRFHLRTRFSRVLRPDSLRLDCSLAQSIHIHCTRPEARHSMCIVSLICKPHHSFPSPHDYKRLVHSTVTFAAEA